MNEMKKDNHVLVVCTRNRSTQLERLLLNLIRMSIQLPSKIVIVDSSDNNLVEKVVTKEKFQQLNICYLRSDAGLPRQRNMAIEYISRTLSFCGDFVTFFDDDVEINSDFFNDLERVFLADEQVVLLGAIDLHLQKEQNSLLRKLLMLSPRVSGGISRSGFPGVKIPESQPIVQHCLWVPGYAQCYRWPQLRSLRFDGNVRMYGEDVEMHLRVGRIGKIAVSPALRVIHLSETIGKDKLADMIRFSDGFRWSLSKKFPDHVSSAAVILSTFVLIFGHSARFFLKNRRNNWEQIRGHLWFLYSLIRGHEVVQFTNREQG